MYRRAHCCKDVANRAHETLMTKLKNHNEFTQMAYLGGENGGGLAEGEGWMRVLCSGRRELRRCSQDRKRRCPDCLASDLGRSQQEVQQQKRRINRSIAFQFMRNEI